MWISQLLVVCFETEIIYFLYIHQFFLFDKKLHLFEFFFFLILILFEGSGVSLCRVGEELWGGKSLPLSLSLNPTLWLFSGG